MKILFIATVGIVVRDPSVNRKLFKDVLGLPLERHEGDEYFFSEKIGGSKHFGLWPLAQAVEACFGTSEWRADRPVPQFGIEFEVEDIEAVGSAAEELTAKGYELLHKVKTEPWGQTIARLQTPEGVIVGISYAPWMHETPGGVK
jgi:catechol 2,3-dioxygenase-like lactoylglutathione lyase family enzyme